MTEIKKMSDEELVGKVVFLIHDKQSFQTEIAELLSRLEQGRNAIEDIKKGRY
jgi:hypothetical protein